MIGILIVIFPYFLILYIMYILCTYIILQVYILFNEIIFCRNYKKACYDIIFYRIALSKRNVFEKSLLLSFS